MATTKREIVEQAYGELALAGYVFDLTPEELDAARKRLDRMMASWEPKLILGYTMPANPNDSDLDENSGLPDVAINAVALNLAVQLAPGMGKTLSADTKIAAKNSFNDLLSRFATVPQMQYPSNLPVGAGNKRLPNDRQYFQPTDSVTTTPNGDPLNLPAE